LEASYVLTLVGTDPPNAKEPQGELYVPEEEENAEASSEETEAPREEENPSDTTNVKLASN
jgi:cytochrome c oxidase cbb3-type subunit 3